MKSNLTASTKQAVRKRKPLTTEEALAGILPLGIVVSTTETGVSIMVDPTASPDKFRSLGGSNKTAANVALANEVLAMLPLSNDLWTMGTRAAGVLALLQEMKPSDAVEGMLCVQAIALHIMGLEAGRRAHVSGQHPDAAARLRKDAVNAMRGMADMLAAIDRKKGKGGQHIRVERVLVTEGGALISGGASPALGRGAAPMALAKAEAGGGVEGELKSIR